MMNWRRLKYLWPSRRRAEERDMQEELEALAEIAGRRELGSLTLAAERARETWGWPWDGIWTDLRHSFRMMRNAPGFISVAAITLALGIGANSAVFSFADAILLRPLPVTRPSEILRVNESTPNDPLGAMSYPDYSDLRTANRSFSGLIAYRLTTLSAASTPTGLPQIRQGMMVSDNFFSTLGIVPALGRTFLPEEGDVSSHDPIAILGYDFWASQYRADRSIIGQTLRLNGIQFTIVGVVPKSFPGMDRFFPPSVFVPLSMWGRLEGQNKDPLGDRGRHELSVCGRLKAGISQESAQSEMTTLGDNLKHAYPLTNSDRRIVVRTELQAIVAKEPSRLAIAAILLALSGVVLIIACANIANLVLARGRARSREIAIRLSIGAGRFRLIRQLMTESLTLALLGSLLGLGVGSGGILLLSTIRIPSELPFVVGVEMDTRVLTFSLFAAIVSCLIFGLAPALQASHVQLAPALKAGGEAVSGRGPRMIGRHALVAGQIALAMVLLFMASTLFEGFRKMLIANPGFRTDHLMSIDLDPSVLRYSPKQAMDFYRKLADAARALPGVKSASLAESVPLSLDQTRVTVIPEGFQLPEGRDTVTELGEVVDENYFNTAKIKILRGRPFDTDDRATSRRVAIVNEEFAKVYWPGQNPLGKRLQLDGSSGPISEVVGVAKTVRYLLPWEEPKPYVYLPYSQNPRLRMSLIAESRGDPLALAEPLRAAVHKLDANLPVYNVRTVASYRRSTLRNWLVLLQMIAAMGLLGLSLAIIGIYGLISYSVSRRTAEIGVRMAMGANRADVLRLVLGQSTILTGSGIAIGGVLAALVVPLLTASLVGVGAVSIASCIAIPILLFIASTAACYMPARRAAMLDPMRALRCE
jgi:putative ABC transport system permease protein